MLQSSLTVAKPFAAAAASARAPRAAGRALAPVRAAAGEEVRLSRRALAGFLAAVPVLLPATQALALIPDDDDEELVEKARANRAQRLASERQTEQKFARSSANLDRVLEQELIPVQRAINSLAAGGAQLEAGDAKAAANALSGSWVVDFEAAAGKLSYSEAAKSSVASLVSNLSALQASASKGSLADAKRGFVSTVVSFQAWAADANVAADLKGL